MARRLGIPRVVMRGDVPVFTGTKLCCQQPKHQATKQAMNNVCIFAVVLNVSIIIIIDNIIISSSIHDSYSINICYHSLCTYHYYYEGRGNALAAPTERRAAKRVRVALYYTILYYTILYHTILYYTILYYTILYYNIILYYII